MVRQDEQRNLLCLVDCIVVANANDKVFASIGIGRKIAEVALVDAGVGDLREVSIESGQDRRAHVQLLHIPCHVGNLDQITGLEGPLYAEKYAGQEVLGDVPECDTNDQTDQAGAADYRQCQFRQSGNPQDEIGATENNEPTHPVSEYISQEFRPYSPAKQRPSPSSCQNGGTYR